MTRSIAVDIGGTFIDALLVDPERGDMVFRKLPTTPDDPALGVSNAIKALNPDLREVGSLIHGTTLGLNAILERKGACVGVITNEGFTDLLMIGDGTVPDRQMYNASYCRPTPLVPRQRIAGVSGRIGADGAVVTPLDEEAVSRAASRLVNDLGVDSIAICFLQSFRNPEHEHQAAAVVRDRHPEVAFCLSVDLAREIGEIGRLSTTVLDAYIRPIVRRYLSRLQASLASDGFPGRFLLMRSGGGAMSAEAAGRSAISSILSGPAGGVAGAAHVARATDRPNVVSFDVGGTSLDICLVEGGVPLTVHETSLDHHQVLIPVYDIRTLGAGGGSIARVDHGLLSVGPASAGAVPGPACYGQGGDEPTVTDAALVLGYLAAGRFLDGAMPLRSEAATAAITGRIADRLGISVDDAAVGIMDVLVAKTATAVRQVILERGCDPLSFSLMAFGGAGPLVASAVAADLDLEEVVIPVTPAGFSAWGMLTTDIVDDCSMAFLRPLDDAGLADARGALSEMEDRVRRSVADQGISANRIGTHRDWELRYIGQEHSLLLPADDKQGAGEAQGTFEHLHRARYGHAMGSPVEIRALRVRAFALSPGLPLPRPLPGDGHVTRAAAGSRRAFCRTTRSFVPFDIFMRARLAPGDRVPGPAIIDEGTATTIIHSGQHLTVDAHGQLILQADP